MTAKGLYNLQDPPKAKDVGTFEEFISEFEDKWLQYSDVETKVKAYFGSAENGFQLFEKWKTGFELFSDEKNKAFPEPYRF
ncbi:MAG: hypothetical protein CO118_05740 [Flavobacteriales bacterium CG_4_9_14_3_um_filter_32_8]|nr:MAG: hypothetical protein CO118_05740 [Flavobacteriales bacterium CG_4_9_14_3_um_filter_32_8]